MFLVTGHLPESFFLKAIIPEKEFPENSISENFLPEKFLLEMPFRKVNPEWTFEVKIFSQKFWFPNNEIPKGHSHCQFFSEHFFSQSLDSYKFCFHKH